MGLSIYKDKIIATATGPSDHLFLDERPDGRDWTLFFRADAWGATGLQTSDNADDWADEEETVSGTTDTMEITKNSTRRIAGGIYVRLNPASLGSSEPITLVAK
jgi:hypothetical protein